MRASFPVGPCFTKLKGYTAIAVIGIGCGKIYIRRSPCPTWLMPLAMPRFLAANILGKIFSFLGPARISRLTIIFDAVCLPEIVRKVSLAHA